MEAILLLLHFLGFQLTDTTEPVNKTDSKNQANYNFFSWGQLPSEKPCPSANLQKTFPTVCVGEGKRPLNSVAEPIYGIVCKQSKAPNEAASKATRKCENQYGPTKPDGNTKCKDGVTFLRNKK